MLERPGIKQLVTEHGHVAVGEAVRAAIAETRALLLAGSVDDPTVDDAAVARHLSRRQQPSLRPVINATGVVLHTNLGRAVLAKEAIDAVNAIARSYSTLEYDVAAGGRGSRHDHVSSLVAELVGAEAGIAVNNCAGAVLLMLAALCHDKDVIVARGELVEIGGGFRVPDVMRASGAGLVEIGTTNKVHLRDYRDAITERTGAILVVHRSNFAIVGFTAQPSLQDIVGVGKEAGVPVLVDLGSGLLASSEELGAAADAMRSEPRPTDAVADGADLIAFSGDKLLGGPQGGLLAGTDAMIAACKKHPLARALRADKLTLAALEATLRLYRDGRATEIPTIAALAASPADLAERARKLAAGITALQPRLPLDVVDGASVVGGGALPLAELTTSLVLLGTPGADARRLSSNLRQGEPPVVARIVDDRVALDTRTILDADMERLAQLVSNAV